MTNHSDGLVRQEPPKSGTGGLVWQPGGKTVRPPPEPPGGDKRRENRNVAARHEGGRGTSPSPGNKKGADRSPRILRGRKTTEKKASTKEDL